MQRSHSYCGSSITITTDVSMNGCIWNALYAEQSAYIFSFVLYCCCRRCGGGGCCCCHSLMRVYVCVCVCIAFAWCFVSAFMFPCVHCKSIIWWAMGKKNNNMNRRNAKCNERTKEFCNISVWIMKENWKHAQIKSYFKKWVCVSCFFSNLCKVCVTPLCSYRYAYRRTKQKQKNLQHLLLNQEIWLSKLNAWTVYLFMQMTNRFKHEWKTADQSFIRGGGRDGGRKWTHII